MPRKSDAYSSDLNGVPPFLSARRKKAMHQTQDQDHTESWTTAKREHTTAEAYMHTEKTKEPSQQQHGQAKPMIIYATVNEYRLHRLDID